MKKRYGWVSNSSSSSFTCDVCGETGSGMDMGMSDFDMDECENGHIVCNGHKLDVQEVEPTPQEKKKEHLASMHQTVEAYTRWLKIADENRKERYSRRLDDYKEAIKHLNSLEPNDLAEYYELGEGSDWWNDHNEYFSSQLCPICQFQSPMDRDIADYLTRLLSLTRQEVLDAISKKHSSYAEFREAMKNENP